MLDRAFGILELFGRDRPEWTTTEIAHAAGLPMATTHRLLAALGARGYVARDQATKRFRLGSAALELGERARDARQLRGAALPVLRRLAADADETALLTVLSEAHDASVCLERVESPQPLRLSVQPGRRMPLHAGASQKALLAFLAPHEVERVLAGPLERVCTETIVDPAELRENLAEIRRRGYAVSVSETNAGVWGLATPVLDDRGRPVAALGLAGPSVRLGRDELKAQLEHLRTAARELAALLGLTAPEIETREEELAWR